MPARYEGIKRSLKKQGLTEDEAQEKAARIYNATRKKGEPKLHGGKRKKKPRTAK